MTTPALCFRLPRRGVIEVGGSERTRWLDGMLTADIKALAERGAGAGCYALLLTRQGRIVADLHVLETSDAIRLELERSAVPTVIERLDKMIIADDVTLTDASEAFARLALEGTDAASVLAGAGLDVTGLEADAHRSGAIGGVPLDVAAYAFTGAPGFQLFVPADRGDAVHESLLAAGAAEGDADLFERLRIEAGTPWLGQELDESVLPAEAGLERAVSTTKGCYTGQEVVARLRSRERRNHVLVGLRFPGEPLAPGSPLASAEGKRIGEVTSSVSSPVFGAIGLGFVRHEHAEPGVSVLAGDGAETVVAALPFGAGDTSPVDASAE